MRLIKLALFAVMVAALTVGWNRRDVVVAAYLDDHEAIEFQLDGLGVAEIGDPGASPFRLAVVSDLAVATPDLDLVGRSGAERTPIPMFGGSSVIAGVVVDEASVPVPGATVRLDRITTQGSAGADLVADDEGRFEFVDVTGGRFRLRAFVPNEMRSLDIPVFLLGADARTERVLRIGSAPAVVRLALVGPDEMTVGVPATLAATAGRDVVDEQGGLMEVPMPGVPITFQIAPHLASVLSENPVFTDQGGASRYLVSCVSPGTPSASLAGGDLVVTVVLPTCAAPPEPEPEPGSVEAAAEGGREQGETP